jgi:hypothetical protein
MNTTARTTTATIPAQAGWYSREGLPRTGLPVRVIDHQTDHGFCSVCGAVWPCARARRDARMATDPFGG